MQNDINYTNNDRGQTNIENESEGNYNAKSLIELTGEDASEGKMRKRLKKMRFIDRGYGRLSVSP